MLRATRLLATIGAATLRYLGVTPDESGQAREGPSTSAALGAYWLGESYRGLPLTDTFGAFYLYGDCDPGPDSGCTLPLEVQNYSPCDRNPLGLDSVPTRIYRLRGGALAAVYPGTSVDVGIGRHTVAVFAPTDREALEAARELRRRAATEPPARYSPPVYPPVVLRELKRVVVARERLQTIRAIARATGVPRDAIRPRLRLARLLKRSLAGVKAAIRPWAAVERDRQVSFDAQELGEAPTARERGISRTQVRRAILRVRGLAGDC